jgi:ABC-type lipoprotein release transport system permease subunit
MRSMIFGIEVYDMRTAAAVVLSLLLVVFLAAFTPALRIARIDPAQTLRAE